MDTTERPLADVSTVSRRNFFRLAAGMLVSLPTVAGGFIAPTTAYAESGSEQDGGDELETVTRIVMVSASELGVVVVDAADGGLTKIAGAQVTIESRYNGKSLTKTTDEHGEVIFDVRNLAENPDDENVDELEVYEFNAKISVYAQGYREFATALVRVEGGGGLAAPTHSLSDDKPYPRTASFDEWDILYGKNCFLCTTKNDETHTIAFQFKELDDVPTTVDVKLAKNKTTVLSMSGTPRNGTLDVSAKGKYLLSGGSDALPITSDDPDTEDDTSYEAFYLEVVQNNYHYNWPLHLMVCVGVVEEEVDKKDSSLKPLNTATTSNTGLNGTWPSNLPIVGGGALKSFMPDCYVNVNLNPWGLLQFTVKTPSWGYKNDNGGGDNPKGWKTYPRSSALSQYTKQWDNATKAVDASAAKFADGKGLLKPMKPAASISATGNFQIVGIAKWDTQKHFFEGMLAAQIFVSVNTSISWNLWVGYVPLLFTFTFDFTTIISLSAALYTMPDTSKNASAIATDPDQWKTDFSNTGLSITFNFVPMLSAGVGVAGIASVSFQAKYTLTMVFGFALRNGVKHRELFGYGLDLSVVLSFFLFSINIPVFRLPYRDFYDSTKGGPIEGQAEAPNLQAAAEGGMSELVSKLSIITSGMLKLTEEFSEEYELYGQSVEESGDKTDEESDDELFDWEDLRQEDVEGSLDDGRVIGYKVYRIRPDDEMPGAKDAAADADEDADADADAAEDADEDADADADAAEDADEDADADPDAAEDADEDADADADAAEDADKDAGTDAASDDAAAQKTEDPGSDEVDAEPEVDAESLPTEDAAPTEVPAMGDGGTTAENPAAAYAEGTVGADPASEVVASGASDAAATATEVTGEAGVESLAAAAEAEGEAGAPAAAEASEAAGAAVAAGAAALAAGADASAQVPDDSTVAESEGQASEAAATDQAAASDQAEQDSAKKKVVLRRRPSRVSYVSTRRRTIESPDGLFAMAEGSGGSILRDPAVSGVSVNGGIIPSPQCDYCLSESVFGDPRVKVIDMHTDTEGIHLRATCSFRIGSVRVDGEMRTRIIMTVIDAESNLSDVSELIGSSKPLDFPIDADINGETVTHEDLFDYDFDLAFTSSGDADTVHLVVVSGRRSAGDSTTFSEVATNLVFSYVNFHVYEAFGGRTNFMVMSLAASKALDGEDGKYHSISNIKCATDGTEESNIILVSYLDGVSDTREELFAGDYGVSNTRVSFAMVNQAEGTWLVPRRMEIDEVMGTVENNGIHRMALYPKIGGTYTLSLTSIDETFFFVLKLDAETGTFTSVKQAATLTDDMRMTPWPAQDCFLTSYPKASYLEEMDSSDLWKQPDKWDRSQWALHKAVWVEDVDGTPLLSCEPIGPENFNIKSFGLNNSGTFIFWPQTRSGDDRRLYDVNGDYTQFPDEPLYQLMACRVRRGIFSEPFVAANLSHDLSSLEIVASRDNTAPLEVLSTEPVSTGSKDKDGNPIYDAVDLYYTALPHVICPTAIGCTAPVPFVSPGGKLLFHVVIRNDGNSYLSGCDVQLCVHDRTYDADGNVTSDKAFKVEGSVGTITFSGKTLVESHYNPIVDAQFQNVEDDFALPPGKRAIYKVYLPIPKDWEGEKYVSFVAMNGVVAEQGGLTASSDDGAIVYQSFSLEPGEYRPLHNNANSYADRDRKYMDCITVNTAVAKGEPLADSPLTYWYEEDESEDAKKDTTRRGGLPGTGDPFSAGIAAGFAAAGAALTAYGRRRAANEAAADGDVEND